MNICFASLSYPTSGGTTSGVGTQIELLAQALVKAGHSISVVDHAGNGLTSTGEDRGVQVYRMSSGRLHWFASKIPWIGNLIALPLREIEHSLAAWRGVRRADLANKLDLIEGTETGMLLVALLTKKIPVVIRLHGEQYTFLKYTPGSSPGAGLRLTRALQRIALRRANLLISPSEAHAHEIEEELGSSHPPVVLIPNAIRLKDSERDSTIKRTSRTVLYAGRIEQGKGVRVLLEAAAQVKEVMPGIRFIIAGGFHSSFPQSSFDSLLSKLGLADDVEVLGLVDWDCLSGWYQRATISVLPSFYETFGLTALEPMMFGTPVVATTAGALPELINELTGKLVPPGDATALAAGIIELLGDAGTREQMGREATQRAAHFDIDRILPLNERLYHWCRSTQSDEAGPHVFLSPHADDVVLSCGGFIDSLISTGRPVEVISVFAGAPETSTYSAFARHLHTKWGLPVRPLEARWNEDTAAMEELGVTRFEHWNYAEAPYRKAANDQLLYAGYDEMMGSVVSEDRDLTNLIAQRIRRHVAELPATAVIYCPLSLGRHVDHQVVFDIGLQLAASGKKVRFYEDYPYANVYTTNGYRGGWLPTIVPIKVERKLRAAKAYNSQVRGLGGSPAALAKRLSSFGASAGNGHSAERYWEVITPVQESGEQVGLRHPLVRRKVRFGLGDFRLFVKTFKWHDLDEMLPAGAGRCLDVGCGTGRHRALVEERGYRWFGLDSQSHAAAFRANADALPSAAQSMSAVVAWQVLEYVEQPELVVAEAARVLEPGGVFCGSVSFLEPVHGRTYFNLSPLVLERLLARHGFADIEIKPGLNGFALMLWTWLRRSAIPLADGFAIPAAFTILAPLAALIFLTSWLAQRLGFGGGHTMEWLSQKAPLEFAGHVMFSARKKARTQTCTSDS